MRFCKNLLVATLLTAQILPAPALGFALLPGPPAAGFVMNLNLGTNQIQTIGFGLIGWNQLAEKALAQWNAIGVGSGPDYEFFKVRNPAVVGNACANDGVNEVRWATTLCGFSFGDALAVTKNWTVDGVRAEADVIFNSTVSWNAYPAQMVLANGGGWLNDFYRVALHEFGHVMGLAHPDEAGQRVNALMNARESNIDSLQPDDIAGAHAIAWHAKSSATVSTVATTTTTTLEARPAIDIRSYFPFQPGHEWTYQHDIAGTVTTYKRSVAQSPHAIGGVSASVWADTKGVSRYMTNDADGVRRHATSAPVVLPGSANATVTSSYSPPELYAPASVVLGRSVTQAGTIASAFSDGTSISRQYFNVSSFESEKVSVPAGAFDTVRITIVQVTGGVETISTLWVANGFGIVKLRFDLDDGTVETFSLSALNFTPLIGASTNRTMDFIAGWNLAGNGSSEALDVVAAFGDPGKVSSVWKWNAGAAKWAFYSPSLSGQALADFAAGKGYEVMTAVNGGEGFWINAKTPFTAPLPAGAAVSSESFQAAARGWSLIAIGDGKTPRAFNLALGPPPPVTGVTPINLVSLWVWDAARSNWYFYAPNLDSSGGLSAHIATKGYLDFGAKTLEPTSGFWLNRQ